MSTLILPLFSEDVDSLDHPTAVGYREILESGSEIFAATLMTFAVHKGVIAVSIEGEEFVNEILQGMRRKGIKVEQISDQTVFEEEAKKILRERG
jgi:hypothetical protein